MINVANGNLIVQADDVDIPERGIDLAFRRTYNSQSTHDHLNTDGSEPSIFGDRWTNTFDAHLAYSVNGSAITISVYDVDGARYDYACQTLTGPCTPPTGIHATLTPDSGCGLYWTKKTGTIYYFRNFNLSQCGGNAPALQGLIYMIMGRNHNNAITFTYSFLNGDASTAQNITQIVAQHSDGQALTLAFAPVNGVNELSSITRPDGETINYHYDNSGDLTEVDRPGNGTTTSTTPVANQLPEAYTYQGGFVHVVYGPRILLSSWTSGGNPQDGSAVFFDVNGAGQVTDRFDDGAENFEPNDGLSTLLQPGVPSGRKVWREDFFSGYGTGTTQFTDTDGHATTWTVDSTAGRVTQTEEWLTSTFGLTTTAQWDTNNNLIATTDPRNYETNYSYDTNGNTTQVMLPSVSAQVNGVTENVRPTREYVYDQYNNVVVYCDPVFNASNSSCTNSIGTTRYTYNYSDPYEPYGYLTAVDTPCSGNSSCASAGNHVAYTYNSTSEGGGDYGLPTTVTASQFLEADNTTTITPTTTLTYNGTGTVASYNSGNGAWTLAYDSLNRLLSAEDADAITTRTCYFADGSVKFKQSAVQYSMDKTPCGPNSEAFAYDADGDPVTELHHYNNTAGTTIKWYDGADRVVEVELPSDPNVDAGLPERTRYFYDLSGISGNGGGAASLTVGNSGTFAAYGNLYKTQRCLGSASTCTLTDVNGAAFDALDRSTTKYTYAPGNTPIQDQTFAYDSDAAHLGLLASTTSQTQVQTSYTYDSDGHQTKIAFNDGATPSRTTTYDPDARPVAILSSAFTTAQTYAYDPDGRVTTAKEATGTGITAPAVLTYDYYNNGWRKDLKVSASPAFSGTQTLSQYVYRVDGARTALLTNRGNFNWTYTAAGRESTQTDPYTGQTLFGWQVSPLTHQYDSVTGLLKQITYPNGGAQTGFVFDAESEPTTFGITPPPNDPPDSLYATSESITYSDRGDLLGQSLKIAGSSTSYGLLAQTIINGHPCQLKGALYCPGTYLDQITGAVVQQPGAPTVGSCPAFTERDTYDFDGRVTTKNYTSSGSPTCGTTSYSTASTYDAENHTLNETCNIGSAGGIATCAPNVNYGWGPSGRPETMIDGPVTSTLHWDGDQLLFISNSSGALQNQYIEYYAQYISGVGLTVQSRDYNGGDVLEVNSSNGFSAFAAGQDAYRGGIGKAVQVVAAIGIFAGSSDNSSTSGPSGGTILATPRTDGYFDGQVTLQGARAYDPGLLQWTTPDAYAGDVNDPLSQRPYMWNGNNPVMYSDPSGYDPVPVPQPAPAPDFQCGPCAPVDNSGGPIGDAVITGLSLLLPGGGEIKLGADAAETLGIKDLLKAANSRFQSEIEQHGLTAGSRRTIIQDADRVKIQYKDGNGARRDVMAHNAHPNEPGDVPHTQTASKQRGKMKSDFGSKRPIHS